MSIQDQEGKDAVRRGRPLCSSQQHLCQESLMRAAVDNSDAASFQSAEYRCVRPQMRGLTILWGLASAVQQQGGSSALHSSL